MKVSETGKVVRDPVTLKILIIKKYGTVRRFAKKAGFTESMVCHILHGRRKLYPWGLDSFEKLLGDEIKEVV